jgi:hypothetical protein
MTSSKKILVTIASVTAGSAAIGGIVSYFHFPPTFASAAIGVVIGVGVALGAFSLTPKGKDCN